MSDPGRWARLRALLGGGTPVDGGGARTSGPPRSANGASSLHLRWEVAPGADAVSVTLEVLDPPTVPRLYFWALQVDVRGSQGPAGGAHLGLQWHPSHPGSTAVNWGGYDARGAELAGSVSTLPSATRNPNTRDLAWRAGRRYRLRIERVDDAAPEGRSAWRGSVQDLDGGVPVVVRDLYMAGGAVGGAVMWSEVFADCDAPPTTVRWSAPLLHVRGEDVAVARVATNYQSDRDGGCANTTSWADGTGVCQRTSCARTTPQGAVLDVPVAGDR